MSETRRLRRDAKHWLDLANGVADPSIRTLMENLAEESQAIAAELEVNQARTPNRVLGAW
jgi:hypothetical protein